MVLFATPEFEGNYSIHEQQKECEKTTLTPCLKSKAPSKRSKHDDLYHH